MWHKGTTPLAVKINKSQLIMEEVKRFKRFDNTLLEDFAGGMVKQYIDSISSQRTLSLIWFFCFHLLWQSFFHGSSDDNCNGGGSSMATATAAVMMAMTRQTLHSPMATHLNN
jgi:hypothetical protein